MRTLTLRPARALAPALTVASALALAGCSGGGGLLSGLNPFARSEEVRIDGPAAPPGAAGRRVDDRGLVDQVTALSVTPMPGGAVIEARGLPPIQGYWDVGLVARNGGRPVGGVLAYQLRVEPPEVARRVGSPPSREVVAAAFVSDAALEGVSTIRVEGLRSAREARR